MGIAFSESGVATGPSIVEACRRHTLFEWSAQSQVDPIPIAKGVHFWTPEGTRFIDFISQLMCVNIGHGIIDRGLAITAVVA